MFLATESTEHTEFASNLRKSALIRGSKSVFIRVNSWFQAFSSIATEGTEHTEFLIHHEGHEEPRRNSIFLSELRALRALRG